MTTDQRDLVDRIIEYEAGELSAVETLELYAELVKSGMAWSLQGHYGRTAADLIRWEFITDEGEVTEQGRAYAEGVF